MSVMSHRDDQSMELLPPTEPAAPSLAVEPDRPVAPISRVVGAYQIVLRRTLEHFFPDAHLQVLGDRSIIDWDGSPDETYYGFTTIPTA